MDRGVAEASPANRGTAAGSPGFVRGQEAVGGFILAHCAGQLPGADALAERDFFLQPAVLLFFSVCPFLYRRDDGLPAQLADDADPADGLVLGKSGTDRRAHPMDECCSSPGGAFTGQAAAYQGGGSLAVAGALLLGVVGGRRLVAVLRWCCSGRPLTGRGRIARFFSDNAFAVYVFHPLLICYQSGDSRGLTGRRLLKFVLVTLASIIVTYIISAVILRKIPLLRVKDTLDFIGP